MGWYVASIFINSGSSLGVIWTQIDSQFTEREIEPENRKIAIRSKNLVIL